VKLNLTRTLAVVRKEFREYRRNRFILYTMISGAVVFMAIPVITVLRKVPANYPPQAVQAQVGSTLFFMLIVPVILPATIAAYSVIGEREQGTLEPVLTTPIRREELLLGKAIATAVPAITLGYLMFAILVTVIRLAASPIIVHDVWQPSWFVAELFFVPLLSVWSVWVCTAVSARSSDVRIAQQLGTLASLPALGVTSLMTFRVLQPTVTVAVVIALTLLVIDVGAWRVVSSMFDRERLVLGTKSR
jgi:ABC-type Na+ efflux pump permease subunit